MIFASDSDDGNDNSFFFYFYRAGEYLQVQMLQIIIVLFFCIGGFLSQDYTICIKYALIKYAQ